MAVFKRIDPQDITLGEYKAYKSYTISREDFESKGIQVFTGSLDQQVPLTQDFLNWKSVEHLFYSNFRNQDGIQSGSYENYVDTTLSFPNNYRILPRNGDNIQVISVPRQLMGEGIKPAQSPGLIANLGIVEVEFSKEVSGRVLIYRPDSTYTETFLNPLNITISHNLDTLYPIIQVYDQNFELTKPNQIRILNENQVEVVFTTSQEVTAARVVVAKYQDSSELWQDDITTVDQTVDHQLGTVNPLVQVYSDDGNRIIPEIIEILDENSVRVKFHQFLPGKVVVAAAPPFLIYEFEQEDFIKIRHGLDTTSPLVQVLEYRNNVTRQIIPRVIRALVGLTDDGEGVVNQKGIYTGDIFYKHGIFAFTKDVGINFLDAIDSFSFQGTHTIFVLDISCKILNSEFNYTNNPSLIKDDSGQVVDELKDAIEQGTVVPYITTLGLYNDQNELLAVAKFSTPIKKSTNTDMTLNVRIDM